MPPMISGFLDAPGTVRELALVHRTAASLAVSSLRIFQLSSGRTGWMPRQHTRHSRRTYEFPDDFPERLVRFQEESKLPWAEINRRLDTDPETVRRWRDKGVRPSARHMLALLELAEDPGLGYLFTD